MLAERAGEAQIRTVPVMKVAPGVRPTQGLLKVLAGSGNSTLGVARP